MLLFIALSRLLQPSWAANNSTVGWVPDPDGRGTLSLVISCVVTLTLCVWSALHLNVPPANSTFRQLALEKTKWVIYGIFAPELVVATAASQYITARWLKHQIDKDAAHRRSLEGNSGDEGATWSITQCFYAAMGGFVTDVPWMDEDDERRLRRMTVTASGIRLLSFLGRLPKIDEFQIQDKSKADWMAKSIVCIQAGWMVAQVIGRLIEGLPVSPLEINTCGHVACAMVLYLLWWSKPFDVQGPSILTEDGEIMSLMYLCSQVSAVNDGINDIRCFHLDVDGKLPRVKEKVGPGLKRSFSFATTVLSVGSQGMRNPFEFIGFSGAASPQTPNTPVMPREYSYKYQAADHVAPECERYFRPPYSELRVRHSPQYCRRLLLSNRNAEAYKPLPPSLLSQASASAVALWNECLRREEYLPYYFTTVPDFSENGFFLGETEFLARYMANFPSLSNLTLGQVNIHRDALRSVLALTAFAYGGLHLSAWNDFFPTVVERIIWIAAAMTIASSGALLWAFFLLRQKWPAFDRLASGRTPTGLSRSQAQTGGGGQGSQRKAVAWDVFLKVRAGVLYLTGIAFVFSRVFLVIEGFISLREAPAEMYLTPEWTDFVPHL
jgi:hypothetical protein